MKTKSFAELKSKVFDLLEKHMENDPELLEAFKENLKAEFDSLPRSKSATNVLKGIIGFQQHINNSGGTTSSVVSNALHDLREFVDHGKEKWFSPRLHRYIELCN